MILSRLLTPMLAMTMIPFGAGMITALDPIEARADEEATASCEIHAVLATKEGDGSIPAELDFFAEQLRDDQFAAFKGFRLLESKSLRLRLGETGGAMMQSGHQLKLRLLGADAARLELHAMLTAGERVLVNTDYRIKSDGILLIGGIRHSEGRIFFAIRCRRG